MRTFIAPLVSLPNALRLPILGLALIFLLSSSPNLVAAETGSGETQTDVAAEPRSIHAPTSAVHRDEPTSRFRDWTPSEKGLMWSYVALSAVDAYQAANIPDGWKEFNPLLSGIAGDQPGAAETLLFKAAVTYGTLRLTRRIRNPKTRKWVLAAITVLQLGVVVHNERATGGIVF